MDIQNLVADAIIENAWEASVTLLFDEGNTDRVEPEVMLGVARRSFDFRYEPYGG